MAKYTGITIIETDRCKGCGLCIIACPSEILHFLPGAVNVKGYQPVFVENPDDCIGCANCAIMCPDSVITVRRVLARRVEHA